MFKHLHCGYFLVFSPSGRLMIFVPLDAQTVKKGIFFYTISWNVLNMINSDYFIEQDWDN